MEHSAGARSAQPVPAKSRPPRAAQRSAAARAPRTPAGDASLRVERHGLRMGLPCRSCIPGQLLLIWSVLVFLLVARLRPQPPTEPGRRDSGGGMRRERHDRGPRALPTGAASDAPVPTARDPQQPQLPQSQQQPQQPTDRPWAARSPAVASARDAGTAAPLVNQSSAALVAELHSRAYGWEVLHAARLDFQSFSELELVSWLRRRPEQFRAVLAQASL